MAEPPGADWKAGVETSDASYKLSPTPSVFSVVPNLHLAWCLPDSLILPRENPHRTGVFSGQSWGWKLLGVYLLLIQPSNQSFIPMSRAAWCYQVLSLWWVMPGSRTRLGTLPFQLCQINYRSLACFPTFEMMLLFPFPPFFVRKDLCKNNNNNNKKNKQNPLLL